MISTAAPMRVRTKFIGPTDTRGARIVAYHSGQRVSVPYNYGLNSPEAHEQAVRSMVASGDLDPTRYVYKIVEWLTNGYTFEAQNTARN